MVSKKKNDDYGVDQVRVLEGLEPVRMRPGMYIGGTDAHGYHHLLREILDNSIDEVINGHAKAVIVALDEDHRGVTIEDDGRGIPVGIIPKYKKSALEIILCTLHSGTKFDNKAYTVSSGLHGVGSSVVNALSEEMKIWVRRDGYEWYQSFSQGHPKSKLEKRGPSKAHGTAIHFRPDPAVFGMTAKFDAKVVKELLDTKAYLHPEVTIHYQDAKAAEEIVFHHPGGLKEFLPKIVTEKKKNLIHSEVFLLERTDTLPRTQLILGWTDSTDESVLSYANGVRTTDGGTHEAGLKQAVVKAVRTYMDAKKKQEKGMTISAEDIREGLVAVLSIYIQEPQFQGQTKGRLNNAEVQQQVENLVKPALERWLLDHGSIADQICDRVKLAARAREASRVAAQQVTRQSVTHRLNLPGKLTDCASTNPAVSELFIVEGDSAGGSAKQGRDRKTQAVLPLRGKVLNTEQASLAKILENKEIGNIVSALGCGIGPKFDRTKLRYHKVFLLMDADSDGHHISTLLLTFFVKHMPELIRAGHLYLALPPLFRVDAAKQTYWALTEEDRDEIIKKLPKNVKADIQRFKGLGEMPAEDLKATTLDPKKRRALRVQLDDNTDDTIAKLMGKDASLRFKFIMEHAPKTSADELDI